MSTHTALLQPVHIWPQETPPDPVKWKVLFREHGERFLWELVDRWPDEARAQGIRIEPDGRAMVDPKWLDFIREGEAVARV